MILEENKPLDGYQLIDSGNGRRLEKFGDYILVRPDPAVLWRPSLPESEWLKADAIYRRKGTARDAKSYWQDRKNGAQSVDARPKLDDLRNPDFAAADEEFGDSVDGVDSADSADSSDSARGEWKLAKEMPQKWPMRHIYRGVDVSFSAKLTPFKHTGIFPEQAANWNFIIDFALDRGITKTVNEHKLLNLFGYTGIASALAAKLGFAVTHVDASKPSLDWAKENMLASGLAEDSIRWIYDDALKFVQREARRGQKYNAIILDPPAFGRGPKGEVWKFNEQLPELLAALEQIIDRQNFDFLIINAYAVSVSSLLLKNLCDDFVGALGGGAEVGDSAAFNLADTSVRVKDLSSVRKVEYGELVLRQGNGAGGGEGSGRILSTGIFARIC